MDSQNRSEAVVTVNVHAAKDLLGSGYRYLDVRTVEEFSKGCVENALNFPYMFFTPEGKVKNPQFVEQVLSVCSKDDHLVVACQSGMRSLPASVDLKNAGFKHVNNMEGGYGRWVENGFPVKKPQAQTSEAVVTVNVHAAKDLLRSGYRYLDVRTTEEFSKGCVENALNFPYMFFTPEGKVKNPQFVEQVLSVCSKDDHLVVACQSGMRSLPASIDLKNAGFKHVHNMDGGYGRWVENGFAVKKP